MRFEYLKVCTIGTIAVNEIGNVTHNQESMESSSKLIKKAETPEIKVNMDHPIVFLAPYSLQRFPGRPESQQ
jgi:hypothetical protein